MLKIQNGRSAKIKNNNKLGLNIPRVSAILFKIQNGRGNKIQNNNKV